MSDEKFKKVEVLCCGFVVLVGNKKGVEYVLLDENGKETNEKMVFSVKKSTKGYAGDVYDVELSDSAMRGLQFNRIHDDRERVGVLKIKSRALETEHQATIQQKKAQLDDSAMYDLLKPLRTAYHATNSLGKSALIARVINIIQRRL